MNIANDPFKLVIDATENMFPNTIAKIQFNPSIKLRKFLFIKIGCCGYTTFTDDDIPVIDISTNIPFTAMVETLAHELSHVVCGKEHCHDRFWDDVFDIIQTEYERLAINNVSERVNDT